MRRIILAFILGLLCPIWAQAQVPVTLAPVARQQFFGANGSVLAGGKLCTYAAGTTTPQATYTDASGTTQASDPIILDGGGFASIWLAGQSYKFILLSAGTDSTCSTGTQQWMVDNVSDAGYLASLQAVLLTGNQTVAGNKTFTGTTTFNGPSIFNSSASFPVINNVVYVGGNLYPQTAAGINSALTSTFGAPTEVVVNYPGSYCDTVVLLPSLAVLAFGPGTYQINIAGVDSTTANVTWGIYGQGQNQTILQSCSGTNKDVITSQNFGSFTGGTNFYGVYHPIIRGLTIDGNKANETAGFGIRLYGRALAPSDVLVQNAYQDGVWTEWGGTESDSASGTQVNGQGVILESDFNGGNGFTFKGATGALNGIGQLVAHNNTGAGVDNFSNIQVNQIGTYENTGGGCIAESSASFIVTNDECTTSTGKAMWFKAGSGFSTIAGGVIAGGIPLEIDSAAGGIITAIVANPAAATACIVLNGASGWNIIFTPSACTTDEIAFTSDLINIINGISTGDATYPLYSGTPSSADDITLIAGTNRYKQISASTPLASNGGYLMSLPTTVGTALATGNTDIHFESFTSGTTCTTAGAVGATCTTAAISLPTAEADTNYRVSVTGTGPTNVPVIQTVTKSNGTLTITIAALTAAAATFSGYDITVTHQ